MIQLNYRDPRPIYEQVKDGIRKLAYSGMIEPDEKLPSVRELASRLAINPNTISRAYKELEQEGFLYTLTGKGTFINQEFDMNDRRKGELFQQFDKVVKELLESSVQAEELKQRVDTVKDLHEGKKIKNEYTEPKNGDGTGEIVKGGNVDDSGK